MGLCTHSLLLEITSIPAGKLEGTLKKLQQYNYVSWKQMKQQEIQN